MLGHLLVYAAVLSVAQAPDAHGESAAKKREVMKESWKALFGSDLDFSPRGFFNLMSAVGAKPLDEFTPFEGVERKRWLKESSERWMRTFFKEQFLPQGEPEMRRTKAAHKGDGSQIM